MRNTCMYLCKRSSYKFQLLSLCLPSQKAQGTSCSWATWKCSSSDVFPMKNEEERHIWARNLLPLAVYSNRLNVTSKTRAKHEFRTFPLFQRTHVTLNVGYACVSDLTAALGTSCINNKHGGRKNGIPFHSPQRTWGRCTINMRYSDTSKS